MIDFLIQWLMNPGSFLLSVFWVFMLADCMTNKSIPGERRTGWILMIIFTHGFGAVIYFLWGKPYLLTKIVHTVMKQSKKVYRSRQQPFQAAKATAPQPHSDYQQGYRAQDEYTAMVSQVPEQQYYDASFEQPQASYPEMRIPTQY